MSKVIHVDNSDFFRNLMRRFLITQGLDGNMFQSGAEALEVIAEGDIGLVISGMTFADMDGYDFITKVKTISPNVPIIALTSNQPEMDPAKIEALGIEACIFKSRSWETELIPYLDKYFRGI